MNEIRMDFGSPATSPEEFEDLSNLSGYPWLGLDPADMCDETQSTSSCGSGRDESIHSRFGSTCSSPCDYDSDVAGVFDLTSEFPFPGNDTWPSDLDDLNIVTKETNPQQFIDPTDWTLQSGSPFLMLSGNYRIFISFESDVPILMYDVILQRAVSGDFQTRYNDTVVLSAFNSQLV